MFGNTLLDILCAAGIHPSLRWVDNVIFFSIRREHIIEYNKLRNRWKVEIQENSGKLQRGGRHWYKGSDLPSDLAEAFAKDMAEPLKDLSTGHEDLENGEQCYLTEDIDEISSRLGIPWEKSKDIPFGPKVPFIGFDWDLEAKTVSLQSKKKEKYVNAVAK